ncbi:MAG: hypothetical protein F9K16_11395 [Thermoanaerobaculia bacterium]|nr:MAG: hypothetical protein F9K16_11395 [Thermoanaerobaculia bacterium]
MPLPVRLAYTAWMAMWVPVYWIENGWTNFLWICDFANFVLLVALWTGSALLATSQLVGVLFIQILWAADFLGRLVTGVHPIGGTEYMFDAARPLGVRALSLFHLWTVPLLIWLVARTGHDRRGWRLQALFTAVLLPVGQQLGSRAQNLNWMWAPFGVEQTLLPPLAFAAASVPLVVALLYLPADALVRRWLAGRGSLPRA